MKTNIHFGLDRILRCFTSPVTLVAVLLLSMSCTPTQASPLITLNVTPVATANGDMTTIIENDCSVIRITSLLEAEGKISFTASKAKDARVYALLFIKPPRDNGVITESFWVPVGSSELDYDVSSSTSFQMSSAEAREIIGNYGITYTTWLEGAASSSEKFPCCQ